MKLSVPILLSRAPGDRILLGVFSPIIMALTGGIVLGMHTFAPGTDFALRVMALIVREFSLTFFCFSTLAFIWACFAPRWLDSFLADSGRRVLLTTAFIVTGAALAGIFYAR